MLYVCATPIGNLDDVTARVLEALRAVELIAAEDTRRTRKLLARYDIHTPTTSLFAHNEAAKTAYVLELLRAGRDVALVTDAGLPGVSDPGLRLVAAAAGAGPAADRAAGPVGAGHGAGRFGPRRRRGVSLRRVSAAARDRPARRLGGLAALRRRRRRLRDGAAPGAQSRRPRGSGARRAGRGLPRAHQAARRGRARHARGARGPVPRRGEGRDHAGDRRRPAGRRRRRRRRAGAAAAAALRAPGSRRRDAAAALAVCLGVRRNEAKRLVDAATPGRPTGERSAGARPGRCDRLVAYQRPSAERRRAVDLLAELHKRTLVFDGAMGTQLIAAGYRPVDVARVVEPERPRHRRRHPPRLPRGRSRHHRDQHLRRHARQADRLPRRRARRRAERWPAPAWRRRCATRSRPASSWPAILDRRGDAEADGRRHRPTSCATSSPSRPRRWSAAASTSSP